MYIDTKRGIVNVFKAFNTDAAHPFRYPPDNAQIFEEWYFHNYSSFDVRNRIYLPIFWTGYYVRANYGADAVAITHLQGYLNALDKTKKYYTIVQYDDGILNDVSGIDLYVFSMSGKPMNYPLPMICKPHEYKFPNIDRNIFMSFVGRPTHKIREKILQEYGNHPECYVTSKPHDLIDYCKIMARSVYALCPRGYGPTSFRIMEALQYGAIPVYVSDNIIMGHRQGFPGVSIKPVTDDEMHRDGFLKGLVELLKEQEPLREIRQGQTKTVFTAYYTYGITKARILDDLLYQKHPNPQNN